MTGQPRFSRRFEIFPEPEWEGLIDALIIHKGTAFLIGATDSGKSTLSQYLIERLISKNIITALIDSDIGQSSLGLPGTISAKILKTEKDIEDFIAEKFFFIGSLNPAQKISLMIEGTKKMIRMVRPVSEIILVDTTGLIQGEIGKVLKIGKVKAVKPDHIIAVQRHDELEHILTLLEDVPIYRVNVSRMARERSREARMRYRRDRFHEYFDEEKIHEFLLDDVDFFHNGKPFRPMRTDFQEGTLIGLNHQEETLALGILLELDSHSVAFKSPLKSVKGINRVVFGDINVNE